MARHKPPGQLKRPTVRYSCSGDAGDCLVVKRFNVGWIGQKPLNLVLQAPGEHIGLPSYSYALRKCPEKKQVVVSSYERFCIAEFEVPKLAQQLFALASTASPIAVFHLLKFLQKNDLPMIQDGFLSE